MKIDSYKKELLKDPEFKKELDKKDLTLAVANAVFEARIKVGVTQEELAQLVETKQPSIARIESGGQLPSLRFLEKIANALGTWLVPPKFAFLEPASVEIYSDSTVTSEYKMLVPITASVPSYHISAN